MKIVVIICMLVAVTGCSSASTVKFPFKDVAGQPAYLLNTRSNAVFGETLKMLNVTGFSKNVTLCVRLDPVDDTVSVQMKLRYSNNADIDIIDFYVNGEFFTTFGTSVTSGWNTFILTSFIGSSINLPEGNHYVTLKANTGPGGVEVDFLELTLTGQTPGSQTDC